MKRYQTVAILMVATSLGGCGFGDSGVYTLYRSSLVPGVDRVHVATFDAGDVDAAGNRENCQIAATLFQGQPGVSTKFWCEAGRYRSQ